MSNIISNPRKVLIYNSLKNNKYDKIEKIDKNNKLDKIQTFDKYKIIIYPIVLLIYFLFYFANYFNNLYNIKNQLKDLNNKKYLLYIIDSISFIVIIAYIVYFYKNINDIKYNNLDINFKMFFIILFVLFFGIINNLFLINDFESMQSSKIFKNIYLIYELFIIALFVILFLHNFSHNDDMYYNTELYIGFFILTILLIFSIVSYLYNFKYTVNTLENSNLSLLSENCFNDSSTNNANNENYTNSSNNNSIYLANIASKYGDNYLQTIGNIPVKYFNKNSNSYSDLIISDFYYPCSYYTYISQSPYNGIPNLLAIKRALTQFKCRFIHLDIYSNNLDYASNEANPVIRCDTLHPNAKPLDLLETFKLPPTVWLPVTFELPFIVELPVTFESPPIVWLPVTLKLLFIVAFIW